MPSRWVSAGWIALGMTAASAVLAAGCGRSTGFESPGPTAGEDVGAPGGSSAGIGSGGQSGTAGVSNTGGSGSNATVGSNGTPGSGAGSGNGTGATGMGAGTGSSTSGGSATSGGSNGGCIPGSDSELHSCKTDSDCICGLHCAPETGGSVCERSCQTTTDCRNLETLCVNGTCAPNFCGVHGAGPHNGDLDGKCNAVGMDDGSCIPQSLNGANVGLCSEAGPATTLCDPLAARSVMAPIPPSACIAGDVCLLESGHANCLTMCDPEGRQPCGPEMDCVTPLASNNRLGVCEPSSEPDGGTTSSGTGGTTSSGATGGSTSGGTTGGGCSESAPISEFQHCKLDSDCGCPLVCNKDPLVSATSSVCEYPCKTTACADAVTICSTGKICITDGCGPGTGNGSFNSTCTVAKKNDGTCLPELLGDTSVGYCFLGGTAPFDAGGCDPSATASEASLLCPPGSLCFGPTDDVGSCNVLCDPSLGTGCPSGSFCTGIVDQPDLGVCIGDF